MKDSHKTCFVRGYRKPAAENESWPPGRKGLALLSTPFWNPRHPCCSMFSAAPRTPCTHRHFAACFVVRHAKNRARVCLAWGQPSPSTLWPNTSPPDGMNPRLTDKAPLTNSGFEEDLKSSCYGFPRRSAYL